MTNTTEQQRLADLIEKGYKLHGFTFGQTYYFDDETNEACPVFAALSTAYPVGTDFMSIERDVLDMKEFIADSLEMDSMLIETVSNRHNLHKNSVNSLESTLELLKTNSL
jgi:hypothetical protein